jgi:hypothetical protein
VDTLYVTVASIAVAANAFSGIGSGVAALTHYEPLMRFLAPAMARVYVPESWLVFPIGTLKAAGAAGLLLGLLGLPLVGTAAATGLILFWVCAAYTHIRVGDYSPQFFLGSTFFLPLAVATLTLDLIR